MSAYELTEKMEKALAEDKYDVVILNFANPDMVGHTGDFEATKKAIATVDECMDRIAKIILEKDGVLLVTADHGNADLMEDPKTHAPFTAHTTNPVPCILISNRYKDAKLVEKGKLADLAPTMLEILGIEKPAIMGGISILKK